MPGLGGFSSPEEVDQDINSMSIGDLLGVEPNSQPTTTPGLMDPNALDIEQSPAAPVDPNSALGQALGLSPTTPEAVTGPPGAKGAFGPEAATAAAKSQEVADLEAAARSSALEYGNLARSQDIVEMHEEMNAVNNVANPSYSTAPTTAPGAKGAFSAPETTTTGYGAKGLDVDTIGAYGANKGMAPPGVFGPENNTNYGRLSQFSVAPFSHELGNKNAVLNGFPATPPAPTANPMANQPQAIGPMDFTGYSHGMQDLNGFANMGFEPGFSNSFGDVASASAAMGGSYGGGAPDASAVSDITGLADDFGDFGDMGGLGDIGGGIGDIGDSAAGEGPGGSSAGDDTSGPGGGDGPGGGGGVGEGAAGSSAGDDTSGPGGGDGSSGTDGVGGSDDTSGDDTGAW